MFALGMAYLISIGYAGLTSFEPPYLLLILNTIFVAAISFVIAYVAAKAYWVLGSLRMLFMGSAVLVFGAASLVAGWLIIGEGPNATVTLYNAGVLVSSIFYGVSVILTVGKTVSPTSSRKRNLILMYAWMVFITVLLVMGVAFSAFPLFFVQGVGPTVLRQVVLGVGTVLYAACGFIIMRLYLQSKTAILYWYSLGLLLIAIGLVAVFFQKAVGSGLGWVGRSAQYVGCIYLLVSVLSARPKRMDVTETLFVNRGHSKCQFDVSGVKQ